MPRYEFVCNCQNEPKTFVISLSFSDYKAEIPCPCGDGTAKREFLHVDDLAEAIDFLINNYDSDEAINIGAGKDISILELANLISEIVGYEGLIKWDTSKPNGTPRKLLDTSKINSLGWSPKISLTEGVTSTYEWFLGEINKNNSEIKL